MAILPYRNYTFISENPFQQALPPLARRNTAPPVLKGSIPTSTSAPGRIEGVAQAALHSPNPSPSGSPVNLAQIPRDIPSFNLAGSAPIYIYSKSPMESLSHARDCFKNGLMHFSLGWLEECLYLQGNHFIAAVVLKSKILFLNEKYGELIQFLNGAIDATADLHLVLLRASVFCICTKYEEACDDMNTILEIKKGFTPAEAKIYDHIKFQQRRTQEIQEYVRQKNLEKVKFEDWINQIFCSEFETPPS